MIDDFLKQFTKPEEEEFIKLCLEHDITYAYSDDEKAWSKGCDEYLTIQKKAKTIASAIRIWNHIVDLRIAIKEERQKLYW